MNVLLILIAASLGMALLFLGGFIWATRSGQFEDTSTPSLRVLTDDPRAVRGPGGPSPLPSPLASDGRGESARRAGEGLASVQVPEARPIGEVKALPALPSPFAPPVA
jgi:cbb3-type cytochrome oxidase maturation protein